jgi:hypothetical protein
VTAAESYQSLDPGMVLLHWVGKNRFMVSNAITETAQGFHVVVQHLSASGDRQGERQEWEHRMQMGVPDVLILACSEEPAPGRELQLSDDFAGRADGDAMFGEMHSLLAHLFRERSKPVSHGQLAPYLSSSAWEIALRTTTSQICNVEKKAPDTNAFQT